MTENDGCHADQLVRRALHQGIPCGVKRGSEQDDYQYVGFNHSNVRSQAAAGSSRHVLFDFLRQGIERHQRLHQSFEFA